MLSKDGLFVLQEAKPEPPSDPTPVSSSQSGPTCGDPEMDKKMKNLKKVKNRRDAQSLSVYCCPKEQVTDKPG